MQAFRKSFGEAIGKRAQQDRAVIVLRRFEALEVLLFADTGGDREAADVVGNAVRRNEIGERQIWLLRLARHLLADGVQRGNWRGAVFVRIEKNIVPIRIRGPETDDGACGKPVAVDNALQHGLRIGIQAARRLAGFWIVQNLRERPDQLPGPEERRSEEHTSELQSPMYLV